MKKILLIFYFCLISIFFTSGMTAEAQQRRKTTYVRHITGTIVNIRMDMNRLYIKDEKTRRTYEFFASHDKLVSLNVGERARVYYRALYLPAISVQKMTPIEYKKDGQNIGYLFKAE